MRGYDCYDILVTREKLPLPVKVDCIFVLISFSESETSERDLDVCENVTHSDEIKVLDYREKGLKYLEEFLNDQEIDGYYRYKTVTYKKTVLGDDIKPLLSRFLDNDKNPIVFKVLTCQYLIINFSEDSSLKNKSQNI